MIQDIVNERVYNLLVYKKSLGNVLPCISDFVIDFFFSVYRQVTLCSARQYREPDIRVQMMHATTSLTLTN